MLSLHHSILLTVSTSLVSLLFPTAYKSTWLLFSKRVRNFVDIFFFVLIGHIFIIKIFSYSHPFLKHRGERYRLWCQNQNKMCGHLQGGGCLPGRHGSILFCHLFLLCLRPHLSLPLTEQPFPCVQLCWELVSTAFYKSQGIQTIPFLPQHSRGDIPDSGSADLISFSGR